jgi:hypothetical protein
MAIASIPNATSFSGSINSSGEQLAVTTSGAPERPASPAESTRVQLSAAGLAQSAAAQVEPAAAGRLDNDNPETAAAATAAAREQIQLPGPPQQGFSFNGVAAFSRIFSS